MAYELKHRTTKTVTKGTNYPLGATLTTDGVNFAVYSQKASNVFLLLFDAPDGDPTDIIELHDRDKFVWHAHVKGIKAGSSTATRFAVSIVRNWDCGSTRQSCSWIRMPRR